MKAYLAGKSRLISFFCAILVGFAFGCGATIISVLALVLCIIFDIINHFFIYKIEQNKNSSTIVN